MGPISLSTPFTSSLPISDPSFRSLSISLDRYRENQSSLLRSTFPLRPASTRQDRLLASASSNERTSFFLAAFVANVRDRGRGTRLINYVVHFIQKSRNVVARGGKVTSINDGKTTPREIPGTLICTIQCRLLFQRTFTPGSAPAHCKTSLFLASYNCGRFILRPRRGGSHLFVARSHAMYASSSPGAAGGWAPIMPRVPRNIC